MLQLQASWVIIKLTPKNAFCLCTGLVDELVNDAVEVGTLGMALLSCAPSHLGHLRPTAELLLLKMIETDHHANSRFPSHAIF